MNPIDASCPHVYMKEFNCAAQQGEPCRFFGLEKGMTGFHTERIESAVGVSPTGDGFRPNEAQMDEAVERSGLI